MNMVRSAEAVCIDHPDKLRDLIADQILDKLLHCSRMSGTCPDSVAL